MIFLRSLLAASLSPLALLPLTLLPLSPAMAPVSPASAAETACAPPAKIMARVELLFGFGSTWTRVSERHWDHFVSHEISPRFPEGYSLFEGKGQWRNKAGRVTRESSRMLLIWYDPTPEANQKIEAIRKAYKDQYRQEAVLRADGSSCVSF